MNSFEQILQRFESLKTQINNARNGDYQTNRELFNELRTLLIENGFDIEVITIEHNDKFFTPPQDFERTFGNLDEKFKDHQGKLASLCTKAIREIKLKLAAQTNPKERPEVKPVIKKEILYSPTSWRYLRNGLFWSIFGLILTLSSTAFYFIGQNSKDKENADLVIEIGEKTSKIKELNKLVQQKSAEVSKLESVLSKARTESQKIEPLKKENK